MTIVNQGGFDQDLMLWKRPRAFRLARNVEEETHAMIIHFAASFPSSRFPSVSMFDDNPERVWITARKVSQYLVLARQRVVSEELQPHSPQPPIL